MKKREIGVSTPGIHNKVSTERGMSIHLDVLLSRISKNGPKSRHSKRVPLCVFAAHNKS